MDIAWIIAGAVILVVTLLDTFFAVLNYNEKGLVANRVARWLWVAMRSITRRLPDRARPLVLRQATGVVIVGVIATWLCGVLLGYAFIYFGALIRGDIALQSGSAEGFWAALYFSIGQFSTVGVENMSAISPVIDFLTVVQALTSVVLLSLVVAFLMNVFNGIQMLRSLCADVALPGAGVGHPLDALVPFFPRGRMRDLDRYLASTWGDMNLYGDVLRQTRSTYYFQSGDPQFSAPFALRAIGTIIGGLRWGLLVPGNPEITEAPGLYRLEESLAAARRWISTEVLRLDDAAQPTPQSVADFTAHWQAARDVAIDELDAVPGDEWVTRFVVLNRHVARLLSATRDDAAVSDYDPAEAHARYVEWLPFVAIGVRFDAALARDLDFRDPIGAPREPSPFTPSGVPRALPPA